MIPSYEHTQWQVGVRPGKEILQIRVLEDGIFTDHWVPMDHSNVDYQLYLQWEAAGNTPKILS